MARIEDRLVAMGLVLPAPLKSPAGRLPFAMARIVGARVLIAGHGPLKPDGTLAPPFGKVGREVSAAEAYAAGAADRPRHPRQPEARDRRPRPRPRLDARRSGWSTSRRALSTRQA